MIQITLKFSNVRDSTIKSWKLERDGTVTIIYTNVKIAEAKEV